MTDYIMYEWETLVVIFLDKLFFIALRVLLATPTCIAIFQRIIGMTPLVNLCKKMWNLISERNMESLRMSLEMLAHSLGYSSTIWCRFSNCFWKESLPQKNAPSSLNEVQMHRWGAKHDQPVHCQQFTISSVLNVSQVLAIWAPHFPLHLSYDERHFRYRNMSVSIFIGRFIQFKTKVGW